MTNAETTFLFELVSPEAVLASEMVKMVVVPGEAGDFGVLVNHAPLLSSVRAGVVRVTLESGEKKNIFVSGGFSDVNETSCTVLAEEAINVDMLDRETLEREISDLKEDLQEVGEDSQKEMHILKKIGVSEAKLVALLA